MNTKKYRDNCEDRSHFVLEKNKEFMSVVSRSLLATAVHVTFFILKNICFHQFQDLRRYKFICMSIVIRKGNAQKAQEEHI